MATRSSTVQIRAKGSLTLPANLRRKYQFAEGDVFTLIDLGDGTFLLSPALAQVDRLADQVAQAMETEGVSLEDLLTALDEERKTYYQERYVQD
jgi:bifunctional DNA-binding transcriptional regulator/antitoxin component of YhaV-PrlF toxin-antitoxin module